MHFRAVREPFNNLRWNFTKLKESEVSLWLEKYTSFGISYFLLLHFFEV